MENSRHSFRLKIGRQFFRKKMSVSCVRNKNDHNRGTDPTFCCKYAAKSDGNDKKKFCIKQRVAKNVFKWKPT